MAKKLFPADTGWLVAVGPVVRRIGKMNRKRSMMEQAVGPDGNIPNRVSMEIVDTDNFGVLTADTGSDSTVSGRELILDPQTGDFPVQGGHTKVNYLRLE